MVGIPLFEGNSLFGANVPDKHQEVFDLIRAGIVHAEMVCAASDITAAVLRRGCTLNWDWTAG
jgi:hypothetical protein